jgi:hypothetical protein
MKSYITRLYRDHHEDITDITVIFATLWLLGRIYVDRPDDSD